MPHVVLTGVAYKEGNQFVSLCPELEVASFGDTAEEALDMLEEALEVYLEELADIGTLAQEFYEMSIEVHSDNPKSDEQAESSTLENRIRAYSMKVPDFATV